MKGDVQGTASKTLQWTANGAGLSPVVLLARPSMVNPAAIMVKGRKEKKKRKKLFTIFFLQSWKGMLSGIYVPVFARFAFGSPLPDMVSSLLFGSSLFW